MAKNEYVCRFCVLLIILYANVNDSQLLTSCDNPLDNEVCELICTTTDHNKTVAFYKLPRTTAVIAQCIPTVACGATGQYIITQPDPMSTVLSFVHSRDKLGTWRCAYGSNNVDVSVFWATYPQTISITLTSNTTIDTSIDVNVTLECLYSEPDPTVTLQYEDASGNNVTSAETFQCVATADSCADVDFTTYDCAVVIRAEAGIDYSYSYSIKLKTKVGNVQREDIQTIATGITFTRLGGTNTSTDNDGMAFVILIVCLFAAYCIVVIVRFCTGSTENTCGNCFLTIYQFSENCCLTFCQFIKEKLFDCCGCECSQEREGDPGFFKDKVCTLKSLLAITSLVFYGVIVGVIVLLPVYYGYSKFHVGLVIGVGFVLLLVFSCLCLVVWMLLMKFFYTGASENSSSLSCIRICIVTPQDMQHPDEDVIPFRQQPDRDERPQSTPNDTDARHLTTGRPLPPRPDIALSQTGQFDSVNSPRPNGLAPIENPNNPPSIDTFDEQKTDKKPKDKKKKKKKKKEEEQDNPAYVQDNNVLD